MSRCVSFAVLLSLVIAGGCAHQHLAIELDVAAKLGSNATGLRVEQNTNARTPSERGRALLIGDGWTWSIGSSHVALGGEFSNLSGSTVCIEFQNGTVAADRAREQRPWPATGLLVVGSGGNRSVGQTQGYGPQVRLFEVCVPSGGSIWHGIYFDTKAVNGGDTLFGAREGPNLTTSVRGRTMRVEIPIRIGVREERVLFDLSAKSAYLVTAYW